MEPDDSQKTPETPSQAGHAPADISGLTAPPQRPVMKRGPKPPSAFGGGNPFGGSGAQVSQNTVMKQMQKILPQIADRARQTSRESLVDSLLREVSMPKDKVLQMERSLQELIATSEKDGCSSGGTEVSEAAAQSGISDTQSIKLDEASLNNRVGLAMQLGIWAEDAIYDRFSDVGLNYKTMVRRLTQQLKQKEELKSTLMTCGDMRSVQNFISEFANQKGGVPSASSAFGSPAKNASPAKESQAKIAGGVSSPQGTTEPDQDQSEEAKTPLPPPPQSSQQQNPFGGPPKPAPPRQGGNRSSRMRGGPRFAAPRMPLPTPTQEAVRPPPVREETKQTNADSGSADDSTFVPMQPPMTQLGGSPVVAEETKEALDIIDNLASKPAVGIAERTADTNFLDEFLGDQSTQNAQTQELGNQGVEQERPDQDSSALAPNTAGAPNPATPSEIVTPELQAVDGPPLVRFESNVEEQRPPVPPAQAEAVEPMATGDQTGASLNEVEEESKERDQQPEAAGETGSQQSSQIIAAAAPSGQMPAPVTNQPLQFQQVQQQQSLGNERLERVQPPSRNRPGTMIEMRPQNQSVLMPRINVSHEASSRPDDAMSEHAASHRQIPSSIDAVDQVESQSSHQPQTTQKPPKRKSKNAIAAQSSKGSQISTARRKKKDQVQDLDKFFMQQMQMALPPESVASSMPITTFEDVEAMSRAYKKKKREIVKLKETIFKLEQDVSTSKQRAEIAEEELAQTQKRLQRVEKAGRSQLGSRRGGGWEETGQLSQRQLTMKAAEQQKITTAAQNELQHQKTENQKLREKIRDLLKKVETVSDPMTKSDSADSERRILEQQHQLELVRQREAKNQEIAKLKDQLGYANEKCQRLQQSVKPDFTEERQELIDRLEVAEARVRDMTAKSGELEQKLEPQNQRSTQLQEELNEALEEIKNQRLREQQLIAALDASQDQMKSLQQKVATAAEVQIQQIHNSTQLNEAQATELGLLRQVNEAQKQEINQLQQEVDRAAAERATVVAERDAFAGQMDQLREQTQLERNSMAQQLEVIKLQAQEEKDELLRQLDELKQAQVQPSMPASNADYFMAERQSEHRPQIQQEQPVQARPQLLIQSDYIPSGKPLQPRVDRGAYDITLDELRQEGQQPVGKTAVNQQMKEETVASNPNQQVEEQPAMMNAYPAVFDAPPQTAPVISQIQFDSGPELMPPGQNESPAYAMPGLGRNDTRLSSNNDTNEVAGNQMQADYFATETEQQTMPQQMNVQQQPPPTTQQAYNVNPYDFFDDGPEDPTPNQEGGSNNQGAFAAAGGVIPKSMFD